MSIDGIYVFRCVRCCVKRNVAVYVPAVVIAFGLCCPFSIIFCVGIQTGG